jgi:glucokinase
LVRSDSFSVYSAIDFETGLYLRDFMSASTVIGVDLGGTKIASAIVDRGGNVLASRHTTTDLSRGESAVLDRLAAEVDALAAEAGGSVSAVGIGSPGIVDARAGTVSGAVNMGWTCVYLAKEIRRRLKSDLPVYIEKDTNAGVLGEMFFGSGRGSRDLVLLTMGTGFGAGVVIDGRLLIGSHCAATDLGHVSLDPNGYPCVCGARGCVETLLSGNGLLAIAKDLAASKQHATKLSAGDFTTQQILAAARAGDPLAVAVIDRQARALAQMIANCAVMLDPDVIILGGGLGEACADLILPRTQALVGQYMCPARPQPRLLPSSVRSSAVGAACIAFAEAG